MNPLVIGCRTTENELTAVLKECGCGYPLVWIETRLHNVKSKLNARLQEILDEASGYDTILFATGFCGNSLAGLESRNAVLVIPRVDDCTSLLLGGSRGKLHHLDSYFLTEGWLKGSDNIWTEYQRAVKRYGKERADHIFSVMFAHYRRIALLDTGCYPIAPSLKKAKTIADAFSLECQVLPAGISFLKQLLTGPWEEEKFLTVPPFTTISQEQLRTIY